MNTKEYELLPGFERSRVASIKGQRTDSYITFNPTHHNPGEDIHIEMPRLGPSDCIVPGQFDLVFDFKVTGTKSTCVNNLSKALQKRLQIRGGGKSIYDNSMESVYAIYEDLWLTNSERDHRKLYGIASENYRKLLCNDDTGAKTGDKTKVSESALHDLYGKQQRICLDYILGNHGFYSPFNMGSQLSYTITLPPANEVLVAQSGEDLGTYKLDNLELRHRTISDDTLASQASGVYNNRTLAYVERAFVKTVPVQGTDTIMNETINIPKARVRGLVLLFTKPNRTDSEEYVYPNIEEVSISIEGKVNQVYSKGLTVQDMYQEAKGFWNPDTVIDQHISEYDYFKDKFSLVVDLRPTKERNVIMGGRKLTQTQNGITLKIDKKAHTGTLNCHIFMVSDGIAKFTNMDFVSHDI